MKKMRFKGFILFCIIGICACQQNLEESRIDAEETVMIVAEPSDTALRIELEEIAVEDQTLRLLLPEVNERFGHDSGEEKYIWSLIRRQDSICLRKIEKILDAHGWIGKSRVGAKANQAIWLVIQHADLERQLKYLPLLKKSVEIGESEGWHLAFLEDRVLMRQHKNQIYGSQAIWDNAIGKMKIYPIDDRKNVNERRARIGLEPIEVFAEQNGYLLQ